MKQYFAIVAAVIALLASCAPASLPAQTYSRAAAEYAIAEHISKASQSGVAPENLPFFLQGNSTAGILLLHGLRATPWEVRRLGTELNKEGLTVFAPLLPGHGTDYRLLENITWREWYQEAARMYDTLDAVTDRTYVGGVSMGSLLAALIAAQRNTSGYVAISTPIYLQDRRASLAWLFQYILPTTITTLTLAEQPHYYATIPTRAVAELEKLMQEGRKALPRIKAPAVVLQSRTDKTIRPESAKYVFNRLGSAEKQLIWLDNYTHVVVREQHGEVVASIASIAK
ncbi:alpha/beta fold hydrolase [Candidatus Woesearchaeota archaeon]|nr:alpha/beta fold hydrolase [Candidatus Woesearchaeota archaeon]